MKVHRNRLGGRPHIMRDRTQMLVSFERDRLLEFEEYCIENKISVSQGLRELLEEFLEKNAERPTNPLNLQYSKEQPIQTDLLSFMEQIPRIQEQKTLNKMLGQCQAIKAIINKRSMELYKQGVRE